VYKSSQNKIDFMARVGSHATKGHASNGGPLPDSEFAELLLSERALSLADKRLKRTELVASLSKYHNSKARAQVQARLSALNEAIKHENIVLAEAYNSRTLYLAIKDVLPDDLWLKVLDRAREIRETAERV
jgi:hypothetical protein